MDPRGGRGRDSGQLHYNFVAATNEWKHFRVFGVFGRSGNGQRGRLSLWRQKRCDGSRVCVFIDLFDVQCKYGYQ